MRSAEKYKTIFDGIKMLQTDRFYAIVILVGIAEVGYLAVRLIEAMH